MNSAVPGWTEPDFPSAAKILLEDSQLRKNVRHATGVITGKRAKVVAELEDWPQLRDAGSAIRQHVLENLGAYLLQFEEACTRAGGRVHWARDAADANRIVIELLSKRVGDRSGQGQVDDHRRDRPERCS